MALGTAIVLVGVLSLGWCLTLFQMPGTWLMVVAAAASAAIVPRSASVVLSWALVAVLLAFAVLGEVAGMIVAAMGTARVGASRRTAGLAVLGAGIGGVAGVFLGLPLPVLDRFVAAILFGAFGALAGALAGEYLRGRTLRESWRRGRFSVWGRLWATLAKTIIATVMVLIVIVALVVR